MNSQILNELSVKELISRYNVVVPEIQREYIWGYNDFQILDNFFKDIKSGYKKYSKNAQDYQINIERCVNSLNSISNKNKRKISDALKKMNPNYLNIGFLYSYRPDYSIYEDVKEDVYLIDGQQRFTTLFLLLFYFSIKEKNNNTTKSNGLYKDLFRVNETDSSIAFDYRVRNETHEFLIDLIKNVNNVEQLLDISNQKWFLAKYKNDITINSIIGNTESPGFFKIAHAFFQNEESGYFDYILSHIKFWHFKTEETSQGEELYITMNSRGQQLADYETIRAKIFESIRKDKEALDWSEKWEVWQDFFWKNRNKKELAATADKGFNEFLRWIQICEMINDKNNYKKDDILNIINWSEKSKLDVKYLTPQIIETYYKSIKYLYNDFSKNFSVETEYQNLNNKNLKELLKPEWLCPKNNQITNIDCFRLLPILKYVQKNYQSKNNTFSNKNLFRFLKYVNTLAKNDNIVDKASEYIIDIIRLTFSLPNNRDVPEILKLDGISETFRRESEEKIKLELLRDTNEREKLEVLFWNAEDMDKNKGEIAHIIKLSREINNNLFNIDVFDNTLKKYKEFVEKNTILWGDLINTNVYKNNGDRVVYSKNWHKRNGFLELLKDYAKIDMSLEVFLENKRKAFIREYENINSLKNEEDKKKQLYIYFILHTHILNQQFWRGEMWNFAIWWKSHPCNKINKSIFLEKHIYQTYATKWMYSSGYNESHGIWIQHNFDESEDYLKELLNWAKNEINE